MYVCMYVKIRRHQHTRTQARGATPELRRVTDTPSHGLSAGRHSTQTTIGSPSLCDRTFSICIHHTRVRVCLKPHTMHAATVAPAPTVICRPRLKRLEYMFIYMLDRILSIYKHHACVRVCVYTYTVHDGNHQLRWFVLA